MDVHVDIKTLLFLCLCTVQSIEASVSVSDVGCDRMQSASTGDEVVADAVLKTDHQSPINIITSDLPSEDVQSIMLKFWNTELSGYYENTGHTVKFIPSNGNEEARVTKGTQKYKVCQFHMHWGANSNEGSEHVIDGYAYSGELHIVSVKDALSCEHVTSLEERDDVLVVGVLLKAVNTPITDTVWERLSPVPHLYNQTQKASIHLNLLLPKDDRAYYFYEGSLTTEPYNEIVQWYVLKIPTEIPEDYLHQLRSTINKEGEKVTRNFREIQPLNARRIWKCGESCMINVQ